MGTIAGALADRGDRKRMMFVADLGRAIFTALIPLTDLLHGPDDGRHPARRRPRSRSSGPSSGRATSPRCRTSSGRSQLARGNGILETAFSASFIVGPAFAGFLVTIIGPGPTLAIDAASFAVSSLGLFLIRRELKAPADRPPSRIVDDIREGVVYVARHPVLRTSILMFAVTAPCSPPLGAALTFRIVRDLGQSPAAFGLALTGLGVGTLVGSLFASRLGHGTNVARVMVLAVLLMGWAFIAAAAIDSLAVIVAMTAVAGAGEAVLVVVYVSVRAANSPGRARRADREYRAGHVPRPDADRQPDRRHPHRLGEWHRDTGRAGRCRCASSRSSSARSAGCAPLHSPHSTRPGPSSRSRRGSVGARFRRSRSRSSISHA